MVVLLCGPCVLAADEASDPGAAAFLQNCMRCHAGILTGNDLQNTSLSSPESLSSTMQRMQDQHTGPLPKQQVDDLIELMQDKEIKFRLEEAELEALDDKPAVAAGATIDKSAALFVTSCASCHTVGGGSSFGGDLTPTINWAEPKLRNAVVLMQERAGKLSDEQIDGLVALLKDSEREKRLAASGYKPKTSTTPAATAVPMDVNPEDATPEAHFPGEKRFLQLRPTTVGVAEHSANKPFMPASLLIQTLALAFVVAVAAFFLTWKSDN